MVISLKTKTFRNSLTSLRLMDVTRQQQELEEAYRLVAQVYARFSTQSLSVEDVYHELCADEYHSENQARTFVVTKRRANDSQSEVLATIRLVTSSTEPENHLPPLEAMQLMRPPGGWQTLGKLGFNPYRAIEFGRLAFAEHADSYASGKQFKLLLCRVIVEGSYFRTARKLQKDQAWAIMPAHVARFVARSGVPVEEIPDVEPVFDKNRPLFEKYDRYWLRSNPRFFRLPFSSSGETYEDFDAFSRLISR